MSWLADFVRYQSWYKYVFTMKALLPLTCYQPKTHTFIHKYWHEHRSNIFFTTYILLLKKPFSCIFILIDLFHEKIVILQHFLSVNVKDFYIIFNSYKKTRKHNTFRKKKIIRISWLKSRFAWPKNLCMCFEYFQYRIRLIWWIRNILTQLF